MQEKSGPQGRRCSLEIRELSASYGKKPILNKVSVTVRPGTVVALLGLNGCGKSTLLKSVMGALDSGLKIQHGRVLVDGRDLQSVPMHKRARMGLGYLLQHDEIFTSLTVWENLDLAAVIAGKSQIKENIDYALGWFPELMELLGRRAGLLSGGQRRMLALAMVLAQRPRVLLLDEPSAGLAPHLVQNALSRIREAAVSDGLAVLLVEQRQREATAIADDCITLEGGRVVRTFEEHCRYPSSVCVAGIDSSISENRCVGGAGVFNWVEATFNSKPTNVS